MVCTGEAHSHLLQKAEAKCKRLTSQAAAGAATLREAQEQLKLVDETHQRCCHLEAALQEAQVCLAMS